jgi:hypothetical protein
MNDRKVPVTLTELMPALTRLYDDFYDINLVIYRANRDNTVIDFRYYTKSSLGQNYREKILHQPPMLHCKVARPSWLEGKERFDINWQHYEWLNKLKLYWLQFRLRAQWRLSTFRKKVS